jgi:flagellar biosynthetic protein FliP
MRRRIVFVVALTLAAGPAAPALAQTVSVDLGGDGTLTLRSLQLIALITILSLAPGIVIMVTCFPFLITVFSILRQALGLQQAPPNMMLVSLALFLTYFVMEPVFTAAWTDGISPLIDGDLPLERALDLAIAPFRAFMAGRIDPATLDALVAARGGGASAGDLSLLVPSFLLSEVARAFEVGFLLFLPFLIIDLVVAAVLMSMGMMMVPPAVVALPFKLAFFVVVDGWGLLTGALVRSYL